MRYDPDLRMGFRRHKKVCKMGNGNEKQKRQDKNQPNKHDHQRRLSVWLDLSPFRFQIPHWTITLSLYQYLILIITIVLRFGNNIFYNDYCIYTTMSNFNVTVENSDQKVGFEAVIRKNNESNIITIPKSTAILGFDKGVRVRVIIEKISD